MMTASVAFDERIIPADLKALPNWICWRPKPNGTRVEKIPVNADDGSLASTTDPSTWTDCRTAIEAARANPEHGIGFVFQQKAGIVGVDLDKCRNSATGHLDPWADEMVRLLNTYAEISPSGTGLHLYLRGTLPPGKRKKGHVEAYEHGRFFTVTGQHLKGTPMTIEARPAELALFYARYLAKPLSDPAPRQSNGHGSPVLADDKILEQCRAAKNAAKFEALWRGEWSGYPSQSDADLALVGILKFYTQDAGQLDRLFRQSGLMRKKWDERRGEQTYGERTIAEALAYVTETYTISTMNGITLPTVASVDADEIQAATDELGMFPDDAWRGPFKDYRDAMHGTSEAPDTAHFSALWAVAAVCLRRRVSFYYAYTHYPNVYLVNFGNTGDSKTSAGRQGLRLLPDHGVKLLRGVGSAEALGDWMQQSEDGPAISHLLFIEELATLLTRGGWEGSTLLSFLTETFDTPDKYEIPFRKNPVLVQEPTPTLIAGTTIEWLWKGLREIDVHGGFGNRLFFSDRGPETADPTAGQAEP